MKPLTAIPTTLAALMTATEVLACYIDNPNAICVPNGNTVATFNYPRATCSLTYSTPGIATANWLKNDVIPSLSGYGDGQVFVLPCQGPYKTYNSCISAYENWSAGANGFQSSPVAWTYPTQPGCH